MSVVFKTQNSQFLTWSLPTEEIFQVHGPNQPVGNFSSCRFAFSATRNAITKASEYVTFGFSFRTLVFFSFKDSLNVAVCRRYRFFSVLAAIIRKIPTNDLGSRMVKASPFIHQPDRVTRKASDVSATAWRYREKIRTFLPCVVTAPLRAGNPCITP